MIQKGKLSKENSPEEFGAKYWLFGTERKRLKLRELLQNTKWNGCELFGYNFTCKTIAMIQQALGEKIVEVVK